MKKKTIIIIIFLVLILGIVLFSLRHIIVGHALKVTISKKTNETISLNIGHIDYDIFNSSVSFLGSELIFNNTFLNEDKTIELSELKFDQINIDNLSILRLLFNREVIADKFTIAKPSLWFMENNNPRRFKEKPKEIINSLKKHHNILKNLTIIVGEIEITHGKIDLKSLINNQEHSGSVEFKLLLRKINTSRKKILEKDEILFAKEHFVKLSNFIYTLPNGDNISFDSAVFDSRLNKLITSNINIKIKSGSNHSKINPIEAQVAKIIIAGINFESLEDLHDIVVDSIKISDANVILTDNSAFTANVVQDTLERNNSLFKEFNKLTLSSFILKNINILNNDHNGDTIININNLNFSVNNIELDSASLANKIPNINYNSIAISTGLVKVIEKKSGLDIELKSLSFNEDKGLVSVSDININDLDKGKSSIITSNISAINISGVSVQDYVNCMPMKIGLHISNPIVEINLQKKEKHNSEKKKLKLDNIEITEINIENGNLHLFENNKMDINIPDFDFNSGIIELTNFEKIHEVNTNNFILNGNSFEINLFTENLLIKSGPLSVLHNSFTINDVTTHIINDKINASVSVQKLLFNGYSVKDIVNSQIIDIHGIKIINPVIKGNLSVKEENKKLNKIPTNHHNYNINISDLEIINGDVDFDISMLADDIKLKSGVDITIGKINIKGGSDTTWLNKLMWNGNLTKPTIRYKDYLINCNNIESDKANETLVLHDIDIRDNVISRKNSGVDINNLHIKNVNISGLKYNTIIDKRTPQVNSITVDDPYFDIRINHRFNKPVITHGQLNKNSLPFDINNIEINNLSFNIETIDSTSTSNISLHTLNLKYDMSVAKNMIDGLDYFDITNLTFTDTIKNSFTRVTSIKYNQQNKNISISDVKGGNIYNQPDNENYTKFDLANLNITGIDITQTFPHEFDIDYIDIDGFNLNVENQASKSKKKKEITIKKINLPKLIKTLNINSVKGTNFNILHTSISDTSDKKLSLNKIGFLINYIKIDSSTFHKNDYTFAKTISINLNNNKFISKDSLYATSVASVSYNFINNELIIDTLLMKPRYKPSEFFKKAVYQTGKMDITTSKIICSDIRLDKLISNGDIHIGGVDVFGLEMFIFRNKKYEMNPNTYKKMPQESLLSANTTLTIDSLRSINSYIQYKQLSEKSVEPGIIFLNKVYLSIFNINNDLKVIDNTSVMTANFKAQLLGESAVDLKMTFPILSPANDFWVSGHVSSVNFTKLNSMTQNLVGVTLKKGTGELDIPLISGNSKHSQGSIAFKYKKLKIELYDRDKAQNAKGLGGNMANLLLNDILIKSSNPGFLGKTRSGEVFFKRNTQKSIVYYTWKSILSGIMSTMGYNNKEQRQEKRAFKLKMK